MESLYKETLDYLKNEDKESAVSLCIDSLEKNIISVVDLL